MESQIQDQNELEQEQQQLQDDLDQLLNKSIANPPGPLNLQNSTYQDYLINETSNNSQQISTMQKNNNKSISNANITHQNNNDPDQNQEEDHHQEELNAVIESISFGKVFNHKKLNFQAISAAISHQEQVSFVKSYLSNINNTLHSKFPSAKNKILAFRVNQMNPLTQQTNLLEGFDDDGEPGSGEKLLGLLQKMEIENIMVFVCVWNTGAQIGQQTVKGGELFKVIIERAKELLNTIHQQIVQQEMEVKKQEEQETLRQGQGKRTVLGTKIYSMGATEQAKASVGMIMKPGNVFKTSMIANKQSKQSPKYAGNNAISVDINNGLQGGNSQENTDDEGSLGRQQNANDMNVKTSPIKQTEKQLDEIEQQIVSAYLQEDLGPETQQECQREVDESLRSLTKANLIELKQFSKPHPLVEKTLQIVCAIRGFKNFQWSTAREIIGKPQFKMELMQTKPKSTNLRPQDLLRAQQILNAKGNISLTPQNVHLHSEGAALLLVWAANLIKLYACMKKNGELLNINGDAQNQAQGPLNYADIQRISARTKIMVKKEIQQKKLEDHYDIQQQINIPQTHNLSSQLHHNISHQDQQQVSQQQHQNSRQQQIQINQKSGTIGHFLQNKQMVFSFEGNQLAPENKGNLNEPAQLVDLSVIKKGGFNSVTNKSKLTQKQEELLLKQEEERMMIEQMQINSTSVGVGAPLNIQAVVGANANSKSQVKGGTNLLMQRKKDTSTLRGGPGAIQVNNNQMKGNQQAYQMNEDLHGVSGVQNQTYDGQNSHQTGGGDDLNDIYQTTQDASNNPNGMQDDMPGRLKIHEVRDIGDDVDDIIGKLKGVDYGIQELDVLIELAKTLKHKRLTLFPDTSNLLMSDSLNNANQASI
eukprot:403335852